MLTGFRVQNFKAFQDTNTIGLAPLTLLSGINSAGKSSLIQMLLLLKQTLESGPLQALNPGQGLFLEQSLGDNFNDFLFAHPKLDEASLVYHLDFAYQRNNDDEVELYDALNALLSDLDVESLKNILHHDLLYSSVVIEFGWGSYGFRGRPTVRVARLQISISVGKQPIVGLSFQPKSGGYQVEPIAEKTHAQLADLAFDQLEIHGLSNFLPNFLTISFQEPSFQERIKLVDHLLAVPSIADDSSRSTLIKELPDEIKSSIVMSSVSKVHVLNLVNTCLRYPNGMQELTAILEFFEGDSLPIQKFKETLNRSLSSLVPSSFAELFRDLFATIRHDLSEGIYYLNSFREPPRRLYSGGQTAGMLLKPNGENFAEVLWRFRDELVHFVDQNGNKFEQSLSEMVTAVLNGILGLKQHLTVNPVGEREDILEVQLETFGPKATKVTLPDVGLGYNQILPIIVQGLLTPPSALVIFEQPEIHLHPEIHARLIDFFAGLAQTGRRVLIETHSTYMIDNLCLAIVKDRSNWLAENSQVLFVHPPDETHPSARIEEVEINRYGKIKNYPPHFLPDVTSIYEQIIKESFAKRREERTQAKKDGSSHTV